jgi:hypothetical protein
MNQRTKTWARSAVAGLTVSSALWACGSNSSTGGANQDGGTGSTATTVCTKTALTIAFSPMYSAFVTDSTMQSFQIPAIVTGVTSGLTWTASDTSVVQLADAPNGGTMITVLKAGGPVTISAFAGDPSQASTSCGSSGLTITPATEAQWQAGSDRYNNGNMLVIPDGGFSQVDASDYDASALTTLACTNCHGPTATNLAFMTISHTPEQAGGFSDTDLQNIITQGQVPANGYFDDSIVPRNAFPYFHTWTVTPDELTGLIVYLRSLTPVSQAGSANFGGMGGGGGGNNGGGGTSDDAGGGTTPDAGGAGDQDSGDGGPTDAGPG